MMARRETQKNASRSFGEMIAKLRTQRGFTRAQLLHRYHMELESSDPNYQIQSEAWLARVERGDIVKLPRSSLESLLVALDCTLAERVQLLMAADRNVFASAEGEIEPAAEILLLAAAAIYDDPRARGLIDMLVKDRRVNSLSSDELVQLISDVIAVVQKPTNNPNELACRRTTTRFDQASGRNPKA